VEVPGSDQANGYLRLICHFDNRLTFRHDRLCRASLERQTVDGACGLDTWQRTDVIEYIIEKVRLLISFWVLCI
jgi:hypothetical protein